MTKPYEQGRPRFIRVLHAYVGVPRTVRKGDVVAYLGPVEVPDVETADVEKPRIIPRITPLDRPSAIAGTPFSVEAAMADEEGRALVQAILDRKAGTQ